MTSKAEIVFETLKFTNERISEEKTKEVAASIIDVLKQHQLTYSQAYAVLDVTKATLMAMSELLVL
jgi:malate/lactate dehydrogenase